MDANSPTGEQQSSLSSACITSAPTTATTPHSKGNTISVSTPFSSAAFLYATQLASSFAKSAESSGTSGSGAGAGMLSYPHAQPSSLMINPISNGHDGCRQYIP